MFHVTIIQQGTDPVVAPAHGGNLGAVLRDQGIDTDSFVILRGGVPADLFAPITSDVTVTATKRSVGA